MAGAGGGLPRHPRAEMLGPCGPQCPWCAAQAHPRRRPPGLERDHHGRGPHHAERAIDAFAAGYGIKWPKAVAKVTGETERLLCFFDYPAEHWVHLRTTNPIESSFSPVRARTRVTKGPGTKDTGLAMVFKLLQAAEGRWRAVNGRHLVALVRAGARFEKGKLIERPDQTPDKEADGDVTKVAA